MTGLRQRLEPLKLYALGTGSLVDAELAAYETALAAFKAKLEDVLVQAFAQTATGEGLAKHEGAAGLRQRTDLDDKARRALVLYRKSVAPFDYTLAGMLNSIRAAGLYADIEQNSGEEKLKIVCRGLIDNFADIENLKTCLAEMLPAHLEAELDIGGITWELIEGLVSTWRIWDSKDFTWGQFDIDPGGLLADIEEGEGYAKQ